MAVPGWRPATGGDRAFQAAGSLLWAHRISLGYVVLLGLTLGWLWPLRDRLVTPVGLGLTVGAIVPVLVVMLVMRRLDKTSLEPLDLMARTTLVGAALAVVAAMVNDQFAFLPQFALILFVVGPGEEIIKFIAVRYTAYNHAEFDHAVDGVFYGIAAGAGFAAIENVIYVTSQPPEAVWQVLFVRTVLSTPSHVIWGGVAGYYMGLGKFMPHARSALFVKGIVIAAIWHGLFDIFMGLDLAAWSAAHLGTPFAGVVAGTASSIGLAVWLFRRARHPDVQHLGDDGEVDEHLRPLELLADPAAGVPRSEAEE